ncbi:MAG: hypothetical protein NZL87_05905, partial [Thermomicrobium sp.]|nr:hypothetical protein [Thermomicrobium sp.]
PLIDAVGAGAVQVTIERLFAYGGGTPETSGRFFQALNFQSIIIRNSTIENTRGIELTWGLPGSSIVITKNRHRNIQGNGISPVGNFVQLREVQNSTVEISWNEIINEYNQSNPEDIISIFKSAHVRIHNNYLEHNSKPGNAYNASSQGTITIECESSGPQSHDNEVYDNQMVDTLNGVLIFGGHSNYVHDNVLVQDGFLPDGVTRMGNGYSAWAIKGGTNNRIRQNVSGFVNRDGQRADWWDVPPGEAALNTTLQGPITRQMELDERARWQQKLATHKISVGA